VLYGAHVTQGLCNPVKGVSR